MWSRSWGPLRIGPPPRRALCDLECPCRRPDAPAVLLRLSGARPAGRRTPLPSPSRGLRSSRWAMRARAGDAEPGLPQPPPNGQGCDTLPRTATLGATADTQVSDDVLGCLRKAGYRAYLNGPWPAETPPAADGSRDHVVVELRGGALVGAVDTQPRPKAPVIQLTPDSPPGQFITQSHQMLLTLVCTRVRLSHDGSFSVSRTAFALLGHLGCGPACRNGRIMRTVAVCSGRPMWLGRAR